MSKTTDDVPTLGELARRRYLKNHPNSKMISKSSNSKITVDKLVSKYRISDEKPSPKGFFESLAKGLVEVAGGATKAVADLTVDIVEGVVGKNELTKTVRGVGHTAIEVTQTTLNRAVDVVDGAMDVGIGVLDGKVSQQNKGMDKITSTVSQTASDLGKGLGQTIETLGKTAEGVLNVGDGVINHDSQKVDHGFEQVGKGVVDLTKVVTIGVLSLGVMDATGIIGNDNVAEAGEPPGSDEVIPLENGDLMPAVPVDSMDGVTNGMADPSATNELIKLGCRDDAVHISDPDRDDAMREAFLKEHNYTESPSGYQVHHVVPLYAGGTDHPDNMVMVSVEEHEKITAAQATFYGDKFK